VFGLARKVGKIGRYRVNTALHPLHATFVPFHIEATSAIFELSVCWATCYLVSLQRLKVFESTLTPQCDLQLICKSLDTTWVASVPCEFFNARESSRSKLSITQGGFESPLVKHLGME
jgi:hypothetical protein